MVPRPGSLSNCKRPVQLEHALSHIDHAQASRFPGLVGVATNTIIGHERRTRPSARVSRTSTFFACEYLAALPSASCAMR